jgi:hypothetical protein
MLRIFKAFLAVYPLQAILNGHRRALRDWLLRRRGLVWRALRSSRGRQTACNFDLEALRPHALFERIEPVRMGSERLHVSGSDFGSAMGSIASKFGMMIPG